MSDSSAPIQESAGEPTRKLTRTELTIVASALHFATQRGVWAIEDLELMGRIQLRLRHLLQSIKPAGGASAAAAAGPKPAPPPLPAVPEVEEAKER